jgi:hypothetical protein
LEKASSAIWQIFARPCPASISFRHQRITFRTGLILKKIRPSIYSPTCAFESKFDPKNQPQKFVTPYPIMNKKNLKNPENSQNTHAHLIDFTGLMNFDFAKTCHQPRLAYGICYGLLSIRCLTPYSH